MTIFPVSEQSYELLFHHHPNPMWLYDVNTLRFIHVNAAAIELYGYSQEEFLSMTIGDIRPKEDMERLFDFIKHHGRETNLGSAGVWKHKRKDGTLIDVEIFSYTAHYLYSGARLVIVHDVTAELQAKEAFFESEQLLSSIVNSSLYTVVALKAVRSNDGNIIDFQYIFANNLAERSFGIKSEQLRGKRLLEMYPGVLLTGQFKNYCEVVESGESKEFEVLYQYDGYDNWFNNFCVKVNDGVVVQYQDITEAKRAQARIRESEERFRTLADAVPVMVWMADKKLNITYLNKSCFDFVGVTPREFNGLRWLDYFAVEDVEHIYEQVVNVMLQGAPIQTDVRAKKYSGEYRWLRIVGIPQTLPDDTLEGYVGAAIDITDQKEFEQYMRTLNATLEERVTERTNQLLELNREKDEFLGIAAHDLKNPLSAIMLSAGMILSYLQRQTNKYAG